MWNSCTSALPNTREQQEWNKPNEETEEESKQKDTSMERNKTGMIKKEVPTAYRYLIKIQVSKEKYRFTIASVLLPFRTCSYNVHL